MKACASIALLALFATAMAADSTLATLKSELAAVAPALESALAGSPALSRELARIRAEASSPTFETDLKALGPSLAALGPDFERAVANRVKALGPALDNLGPSFQKIEQLIKSEISAAPATGRKLLAH